MTMVHFLMTILIRIWDVSVCDAGQQQGIIEVSLLMDGVIKWICLIS